MTTIRSAIVIGCSLVPIAAHAGNNLIFTEVYGHTFSEIGAAGNTAYPVPRFPGGPIERHIGAVDYRYRIATQEVQGRHWIEFVNAYAPYVGNDFLISGFQGITSFVGFNNGVPYYTLSEGNENIATIASMRYMTRYCNWLHNGKPTGPDVPPVGLRDRRLRHLHLREHPGPVHRPGAPLRRRSLLPPHRRRVDQGRVLRP